MNRKPDTLALAAIVLFLVLFGFFFTYWGPFFEGQAFPPLIHVHALLWFGWFVLLVLQAWLVRSRHVHLHRVSGSAISLYTAGLIVVSFRLALPAIARDRHLINGELESVPTIVPLTQILMFTAFFGLALARRNRLDSHKRLILLAALVGMTPSLARMSIGLLGRPLVPLLFVVSNALVVVLAWLDRRAQGRWHPVYVWGGLAIIVVRIARVPLALSPAWRWFADTVHGLTT